MEIYNLAHPMPGQPVKAGGLVVLVPPQGESTGDIVQDEIRKYKPQDAKQEQALRKLTEKRILQIVDWTRTKEGKMLLSIYPPGSKQNHQEDVVTELQRQIQELQAKLSESPAPKRRGRPKKEVVNG